MTARSGSRCAWSTSSGDRPTSASSWPARRSSPLFAVAWRFLVAGTLMAGLGRVAARCLGPSSLAAPARRGRPHRLALAGSERVALRRRARGADRPRVARDRVGTAPRGCAALHRRRPADSRRRSWASSIGFVGIALLVRPSGDATAAGLALVVGSALAWAVGSYLSGRLPLPRDVFAATALEMLAGGLFLLPIGLLDDRLRAVGVVGEIDLRLVVPRRVRLALRLHRLCLAPEARSDREGRDLRLRQPRRRDRARRRRSPRGAQLAHPRRRRDRARLGRGRRSQGSPSLPRPRQRPRALLACPTNPSSRIGARSSSSSAHFCSFGIELESPVERDARLVEPAGAGVMHARWKWNAGWSGFSASPASSSAIARSGSSSATPYAAKKYSQAETSCHAGLAADREHRRSRLLGARVALHLRIAEEDDRAGGHVDLLAVEDERRPAGRRRRRAPRGRASPRCAPRRRPARPRSRCTR